jgi:CTP:molybdopterin cytidylyltransferase MocA
MKKVGIILLAAGNSTRYHGIKLLDIIGDKKMYLHILEISSRICVQPKIIVTQYEEIQEKASEYGFETVMNIEPQLGISHSIQLGLHKALDLAPDLDGVLFSVCDQPYLELATMERLLLVFSDSQRNMASVSYQGILGNPCIIGKQYFKELFALTGDIGGKKVISRFPEDVELVPVENEKELMDIDSK